MKNNNLEKGEIMIYLKKMLLGVFGLVAMACGLLWAGDSVSALSMTPMKQAISLMPGDTYTGRVTIYQQGQGDEKVHYQASIVPLSVNDENNEYYGIFDQETSYTDIVNWVTLTNGKETVNYGDKIDGYAALGEEVDLIYTIKVPQDARGGGHYFAVKADTVPDSDAEGNVTVMETISIASVVYAEVAGDIKVSGSIKDNSVSGFLLNPPIKASFLATNEGNTHAEITYYMQVFPLFSGEEVYTTEENPSTDYVLPETTRYIEQEWNDTPSIGVFKVRQVVYYGSTNNEPSITEKIVIICPMWLLFVIFFVIAAVVIWIVMRVRVRGKKGEKKAEKKLEE